MFLVKAKMFPKVPFFICLDEMNLAPVEHYFAEILSILETRKHPKIAGTDEVDMEVIKTDPIVEARYFKELGQMSTTKNVSTGQAFSMNLTDRDIYMKLFGIETENDIDEEVGKKNRFDNDWPNAARQCHNHRNSEHGRYNPPILTQGD